MGTPRAGWNDLLRSYVPDANHRYEQVLVARDVGMLRWSADSDGMEVHDGADSYVVRDGRIVAQTIHYSTRVGDAPGSAEPGEVASS